LAWFKNAPFKVTPKTGYFCNNYKDYEY
jgi:hypothetical protein